MRSRVVASILALALAVDLAGCTSRGGGKPPSPPSPPAPATKTPLLFAKGRRFVDSKGTPVKIRFHESCCTSEDGEPDPAWSLATREHLDRIRALGFNGTHWRLGPWTPLSDFPDSLRAMGGGYLQVDGLRVDLEQWNPRFWTELRKLADYAKSIGIYVEIDLIDGWACKKTKGWWQHENPGYMPWIESNNVQGFDAFAQCGKIEIKPGAGPESAVFERWLRKIVETLGDLDNIVWQDGNEIILVDGYTPAWTASIANVVRDEEAKRGFPRHLFGTNAAATSAPLPQVDFVNVHTQNPMTAQDCNTTTKPCRNNEYNPNPPHSPAELKYLVDLASGGAEWGLLNDDGVGYWDYWRGGQTKAQMEQTAQLLNAPPGPTETGCNIVPGMTPEDPVVKVEPRPAFKWTAQVNAAIAELWPDGVVRVQQKVGLRQLAQKLRDMGLCATLQRDTEGPVDQITVGAISPIPTPEGKQQAIEGQGCHALNCKVVACDPDHNPDCGCDGGNVSVKPAPACYINSDTWRKP